MNEKEKERRQNMATVLDVLERHYPPVRCALIFEHPWQLLVATILSAQCTDRQVNLVTRKLFARFPGPREMAAAESGEVEQLIHSTGFFRNKAKNLIACAAAVLKEHQGRVPRTMEDLVALPGVGRKTANVVLGNAFGIPGFPVDTHVRRLARRLGWTRQQSPERIEAELCADLPAERWTLASHLLIHHGREICKARRPQCSGCPVLPHCPRTGVDDSR
jgi:endonuclease-3